MATDAAMGRPRIRVVGCGGAGTNALHRLVTAGLRNARTTSVDTDQARLRQGPVDQVVLLGDGLLRGTGGVPDVGARLAWRQERELRAAVSGADLTFVLAGLGGGVGTGVAPIVARWAHASGSVVVGLVTTPFRTERSRQDATSRGLAAMRQVCNSLVVLENERLLSWVPHLPVEQAFAVLDHLMGELIRGLSDAIFEPSLIQLDFPDLRAILEQGGTSTLVVGEGDPREPEAVADAALGNTLFASEPRDATGAIVHVTAGPTLPISSVHRVVTGLTRGIRRDARLAFGVRSDPEFDGALRVLAVLTGVQASPPPAIVGSDLLVR